MGNFDGQTKGGVQVLSSGNGRSMGRRLLGITAAVATAALAVGSASHTPASSAAVVTPAVGALSAASSGPPNVLLIVADDMRYDDLDFMPSVQSLLVEKGTTFSRFYAPFPRCCPARATILTGQYAHNHGVLSNRAPYGGYSAFDDRATLATWLTPSYKVGLVGKYLNGYGNHGTISGYLVPPGWDYWRAALGATTYNYTGMSMSIDGYSIRDFSGKSSTRVIAKLSSRLLSRSTHRPFFLFSSFVAPHCGLPRDPDDPPGRCTPYVGGRYGDTYAGPPVPDDPTFNEPDISDKRPSVRANPLLTRRQITAIEESYAQRRESLRLLDDQVARLVAKLRRQGALRNTYIIFVSDNGYMEGEHRIKSGKGLPYSPASHMPLVVRGPAVPAGQTVDGMAGMQDLAPTILAMTRTQGSEGTAVIDGRSLLPYFTRPAAGDNRTLVLEAGDDQGGYFFHGIVRGDGWKYVEFTTAGVNEVEMYNLDADPYEDFNLSEDPQYDRQQNILRKETSRLEFCAGLACR